MSSLRGFEAITRNPILSAGNLREATVQTIQDFEGTKNAWFRAWKRWQFMNYALGLSITIGSLAVASAPPFLAAVISSQNLAFIVAALSALFTFLRPADRSKSFREAWLILDQAIIRFKAGLDTDMGSVLDANMKGEAILAGSTQTAPAAKVPSTGP
jgi:hypothetical protein